MATNIDLNLLLNQAVDYHKQGNYGKAKEIYQFILLINNKHFDALQLLGLIEYQTANYLKAVQYYEKAVKINDNNSAVMNAMGLSYAAINKFDSAIQAYDKALKINPKEVDALNNKANLLSKLKQQSQANIIFQQAYEINPKSPITNYNYGNHLLELKKYRDAIKHYVISIDNKANNPLVYNNLCLAYIGISEKSMALEYGAYAIKLDPNNTNFIENFKTAMGLRSHLTTHSSDNVRSVVEVLMDDLTIRPETIVDLLLHLARLDFINIDLFNKNENPPHDKEAIHLIRSLSKNKLFLKLLTLCPISDIKIETLLVHLRKYILFNHEKIEYDSNFLNLLSAMAIQNYINEYISPESVAEKRQIKIIQDMLRSSDREYKKDAAVLALILSTFYELDHNLFLNNIHENQYLKRIYHLHVKDKATESMLKHKIETIGEINNNISKLAKNQYEESPYPRWFYINSFKHKISIHEYFDNLELEFNRSNFLSSDSIDVLVAGSGTGRSTIELFKNFKNLNITAIDLSLSSLAYSKRMASFFDAESIDFKQCDILNVSLLGKHFDIINADGVLHHLENPADGFKSLTNILKPGGFMKIGLYSKVARKDINLCRDEISNLGFTDSLHDIKKYRNICAISELPHHRGIRSFSDFYSLSEFRDLVFHVQEHQFDLKEISNVLNDSNLSFCGFSSSEITNKIYSDNLKKKNDLNYLDEYESINPHTFKEMYQFWCQKYD